MNTITVHAPGMAPQAVAIHSERSSSTKPPATATPLGCNRDQIALRSVFSLKKLHLLYKLQLFLIIMSFSACLLFSCVYTSSLSLSVRLNSSSVSNFIRLHLRMTLLSHSRKIDFYPVQIQRLKFWGTGESVEVDSRPRHSVCIH